MAIKRQSKGKYRPGDNPCGQTCKGNTYCQCKWAVSSCLGTRPDCPVSLSCKPCPSGYKCSGNGFASPPKSSWMSRVDDLMARLRGAYQKAPPS